MLDGVAANMPHSHPSALGHLVRNSESRRVRIEDIQKIVEAKIEETEFEGNKRNVLTLVWELDATYEDGGETRHHRMWDRLGLSYGGTRARLPKVFRELTGEDISPLVKEEKFTKGGKEYIREKFQYEAFVEMETEEGAKAAIEQFNDTELDGRRLSVNEARPQTADEFLGDVIGDLNARRGRVQRIESRAAAQMIRAEVPLAEMFGYATTLRSLSQGRATHTMQFVRYEPVPATIAEEIVSRMAGRPTAR